MHRGDCRRIVLQPLPLTDWAIFEDALQRPTDACIPCLPTLPSIGELLIGQDSESGTQQQDLELHGRHEGHEQHPLWKTGYCLVLCSFNEWSVTMLHHFSHDNFAQVNHAIASNCMVCQAVHILLMQVGIHNPMKACAILTQGCNYPLLWFNKLLFYSLVTHPVVEHRRLGSNRKFCRW